MANGLSETKAFLESKLGALKPTVGMVLGSGLSDFAKRLENPTSIPYADIPNFKTSTVDGHPSRLVIGGFKGKTIAALCGRVHYYEGHAIDDVTFPVRVLDAIGCKTLVVTNAAGGVNPNFHAGNLMIIEDHINMMGISPLMGTKANGKERFLDLSAAYSTRLRDKIADAATKLNVELQSGIYLAVTGPNYETPAEVKAFAWMGADAVGMSSVPEVIVARQVGMEVCGICLISNLAAGITSKRLNHEEVLAVASQARESFARLMEEFVPTI